MQSPYNPKPQGIDPSAPGSIGGTTPSAVYASPAINKGPAIITSFAGFVSTAGSSTTITFTSAADAILAGYSSSNPVLGTTLITTAVNQAAVTRYIFSWASATQCVVDTACTLAASSTLASVQLPIATFVNSAGVGVGAMNAAGNVGIGTMSPGQKLTVSGDLELMTNGTANRQILVTGLYDLNIMSAGNVSLAANSFTPLRLFKGNLALTIPGMNLNVGAADDADLGFFVDRTAATTWRAKGSGTANPTLIRSNLGNLRFYTDTGKTVDNAYTPTERMVIQNDGNVGIGTTGPTALLNIKAGTATAHTQPLQFTSGTLLTSPEVGSIEFLIDAYYGTLTTNAVRRMFVMGTTGRATAQTTANASVAAYTLGAADASFEVSANVLVTTSSAEAFTVTCSYTDEGNTARVQTMPFVLLAGTTVAAINFANGAVPYEGIPMHIRCKASTAITIATAGTFTGATYNVEGVIKKTA